LEERSNGKGKLAEASEEGQGPRRAVEPMMMMMMMMVVWGNFYLKVREDEGKTKMDLTEMRISDLIYYFCTFRFGIMCMDPPWI